jgi:hypothetical protein
MAQELTFSMLMHALWSMRDGPNSYVTVLLTFLQTVLRHPEGLASLEHAVPWADPSLVSRYVMPSNHSLKC